MKNKNVLVVGMARSGIAAAKLLSERGAHVRISDIKTKDQFTDGLKELERPGIEWRLGEKSETLLDGMDLLVISPGVPIDKPVVVKAKEMGIPVIGELELAYRMSQGSVVAITGTNGKTTTTTLMGEIFKNMGKRTFVVGNIGYPYSAVAAQTQPDDVVVAEVSSFQLETIDTFHPTISAILNITEDHLVRHGTMEVYIALKARIFENQHEDDTVVLNYDDPIVRGLEKQPLCNVIYFSRTQVPPCGAYVRDGEIVFRWDGVDKAICPAAEVYIPGPHNLENALAATAMAMAAGVPAAVIRHTLRTFKGVEHRIEFVREIKGVRFINDSKGTNVDSTIKAVDTMKTDTVLIAGGSDKHTSFEPLCKAIVRSKIRHVVLIGDTAPQLERQLKEAGFESIEHAGYDFQKAIDMAFRRAECGWNVLLSPACASFDMFTDYEHRGREFKRIVGEMSKQGR